VGAGREEEDTRLTRWALCSFNQANIWSWNVHDGDWIFQVINRAIALGYTWRPDAFLLTLHAASACAPPPGFGGARLAVRGSQRNCLGDPTQARGAGIAAMAAC
jgi:hypothetical protein